MKNFLFLILFFSVAAKAQLEIQPFGDVKRTPLMVIKHTDVEGSPYFYNFWVKGKVTLKNGKSYSNDSLKFDLVDDKLIFKNDDGTLMYFAEPVGAFDLLDKDSKVLHFKNGLPASNGLNAESYFQIIYDGKIPLFKRTGKFITESKQYNSASTIKSFNTIFNYYTLQNEALIKVSLNKKTIVALFGIKEEQLNDYLKQEKIDLKKDDDLNKLFTYFNK